VRKGALVLFVLLIALPAWLGIGYALLNGLGLVGFKADGFTTEHLAALFNTGRFAESFSYTLLLAVSVTLMATVLAALVLRVLFTRRRSTLPSWFFLPLAMPPIVAAFFSFHFLSNTGLLSRLLASVGLISSASDFPTMVNDRFGIAVFLTHTLLSFAFFTVLFLLSASRRDVAVQLDAARTLGASAGERFFKLLLPLVLRRNITLIVVWFVFVLGTYEVPLLLGSQSLRPMSVEIIDKLRGYSLARIPEGYALSALWTLFIAGFALLIVQPLNRNYGR
jgi:putative spermidine/putrescine transport system permease protein